MKFGKISFVSMICVLGATGVSFATPSVRMVGGDGTYDSAALAAAAAVNADESVRSGSLRAVGMVRPTGGATGGVSTGGTVTKSADAGSGNMLKKASLSAPKNLSGAKSGTVSMPRTTTNARIAVGPRLSIGSYVGAGKPTSMSTSTSAGVTSDLLQRIDALETNVDNLESQKIGKDSFGPATYIYTDSTGELVLDVNGLRDALQVQVGQDGHEVELHYDDDGLLWRYAGENAYRRLVTWDQMCGIGGCKGEKGDKGDPGERGEKGDKGDPGEVDMATMNAAINSAIVNAINLVWADTSAALNAKVDVYQNVENAGKVLIVNQLGDVDVGDQVYTKTEIDQRFGNVQTLGALASKDIVTNNEIDEGTIQRSKFAEDITKSLELADFVGTGPTTGRHVLGVVNGDKQWLQVIVPDEVQY